MPSIKKQAPKQAFASKALVVAGILLPFLLLAMLLGTHGAFDTVRFYGTIQPLFAALVGVGAITLLAAAAGCKYRDNKSLRCAVLVLAAVSVIIILAVASFVYLPYFSRSGDVPPQLVLTGSNGDAPAVALVFYTEKPTLNTVVFNGRTITEATLSNQHWFNLDPKPGTDNSYSINGGQQVGFKTPAPDKLRFAASGDSHSGGSGGAGNPVLTLLLGSGGTGNSREDLTAKMYSIMKSNKYDEIFVLGDATQYGFSDAHWKDALSLSAPTTATVPIEFVPGNHDSMFNGIRLYETYLCQDGQNESVCLMKHIRNGKIDIITLDLEWDLQLYTPQAQQWLEKELSSVPQDHWLIVMSHTFYYCSGGDMDGWTWYDNPNTIGALVPLFEKNHVDLVLSGHKHHVEVLKKNGITYAVVGAFGGVQDPERTYFSPASVWYEQGAYAFADVNIEGNNATLTIRDYNNTVLYSTNLQNN